MSSLLEGRIALDLQTGNPGKGRFCSSLCWITLDISSHLSDSGPNPNASLQPYRVVKQCNPG